MQCLAHQQLQYNPSQSGAGWSTASWCQAGLTFFRIGERKVWCKALLVYGRVGPRKVWCKALLVLGKFDARHCWSTERLVLGKFDARHCWSTEGFVLEINIVNIIQNNKYIMTLWTWVYKLLLRLNTTNLVYKILEYDILLV